MIAILATSLALLERPQTSDASIPGVDWTARTSAADIEWTSVTYGNGLFVAVAYSGYGNRVMTSPDGINWTIRNSAADNNWLSVTYGNGLFVAVAITGAGNRVMTSPDGINWTARTSAADNFWWSVTHGDGLFVAVAWTGTGDRVMTSPDGIDWTIRSSAANNEWLSVTYGNGLFVAVAATGTGNRVMTSGQVPQVLNVTTQGDGFGTVTSDPAAIDCGLSSAACQRGFAPDSTVTLTATPGPGSVFTGWSGACTGSDACRVTMDEARSVTAEFQPGFDLIVTRLGNGAGTVTSTPAGIGCGASCGATFLQNSVVTLTATPGQNSNFTGFSGACTGPGPCHVTMDATRAVNAGFTLKPARFSRVKLSPKKRTLRSGQRLRMTLRVTNSGGRAGTAVVRIRSDSPRKVRVPRRVRLRVPAGRTGRRAFTARTVRRQRGRVVVTARVAGRTARSVIRLRR